MADEYQIKRIESAIGSITPGQIAVEPSADPDLNFVMWGGRDYNGDVTRFLSKDKAGRLTTLGLIGPSTTGEDGILKHDANGNVTGGQLTIDELNDLISDGPIGPSYWDRDEVDGYLFPVTVTDTLVVGDGVAADPSYAFASSPNSGWFYDSGVQLSLAGEARLKHEIDGAAFKMSHLPAGSVYHWHLYNYKTSSGAPAQTTLESEADTNPAGAYTYVKATSPATKIAQVESEANGGIAVNRQKATAIDNYAILENLCTAPGTATINSKATATGTSAALNVVGAYNTGASPGGDASARLEADSLNDDAFVNVISNAQGVGETAETYIKATSNAGPTAVQIEANGGYGGAASAVAELRAFADQGTSVRVDGDGDIDLYSYGRHAMQIDAPSAIEVNYKSQLETWKLLNVHLDSEDNAYTRFDTQADAAASTWMTTQSLNGSAVSRMRAYRDANNDAYIDQYINATTTAQTLGWSIGEGAAYMQFEAKSTSTGSPVVSSLRAHSTANASGYTAAYVEAIEDSGGSFAILDLYVSNGDPTTAILQARANNIGDNATTTILAHGGTGDTGEVYITATGGAGNIYFEAGAGDSNGSIYLEDQAMGGSGVTGPVELGAPNIAVWDSWKNRFGEVSYIETFNQLGAERNYLGSTGHLTGGLITEGASQTFDVAAGTGYFRALDSSTSTIYRLPWSASTGNTIADGETKYVFTLYNGGSPIINIKPTFNNNLHTEFFLGSVVREGNTLHILNNPDKVSNPIAKISERFRHLDPTRAEGLLLGETGTRNVTVTAGEVYWKLNEFDIPAFDTSGTDSFDSYLGATLDSQGNTQWDNQNYNNGGTKTALTTNRWSCAWFFVEVDGALVHVYGTSNATSEAAARAEPVPSTLPPRLSSHGILIGRIVFQQGASTAAEIESAFTTTFTSGAPTSHNLLTGLQGGAADDYWHVTETQHGYLLDNMPITSGQLVYTDTNNALTGNQYMTYSTTGAAFTHNNAAGSSTLYLWSDSDGGTGSATTFLEAHAPAGGSSTVQINATNDNGTTNVNIYSNSADTAGGSSTITISNTGNGYTTGLQFGASIVVTGELDLNGNDVMSDGARVLSAGGTTLYVGQDTGADLFVTVDVEASTAVTFSIDGTVRAQFDADGLEMNNYDIYEIKTATFNSCPTLNVSGGAVTVALDDYQKAIINLNNSATVTITLNEPRGVMGFTLWLVQGDTTATTTINWATEGTHAVDRTDGGLNLNTDLNSRTIIGGAYDGSRYAVVSTPLEQAIAS